MELRLGKGAVHWARGSTDCGKIACFASTSRRGADDQTEKQKSRQEVSYQSEEETYCGKKICIA